MEHREDLKAFIDGELPTAKAESIQKAAESDPAVQRELEELRAVGEAMQAMKREHDVYGFERTLMALGGQRAGYAPKPKRRPWLGFGAGIALAAIAALVFTVPQLLSHPHDASTATLAAMRYERNKPFGDRNLMQNGAVSTAAPKVRAKAPAAASVTAPRAAPMTLQDQLKTEQAQIQDLQKQVAQLKGIPIDHSRPKMADRVDHMALPAPPAMSGAIVPGQDPSTGEASNDQLLYRSQGLPPAKVASLEAQVKKLATQAGGEVQASGPSVIRSISITIATPKSAALVTKIRGVLKGVGSVTVEDIPQKTDDARSQSTLDRIVDLKLQREKLLQDFLPEAPQVRDLDTQIKVLQDTLKPVNAKPLSRIHVGIG